MKKLLLFLFFLLGNVAYSSGQHYGTYFSKHFYAMSSCDYIIKGEIIDKKIVAYTVGDFNVVAIKVAITEKYGSNLEDTVWIYPDFEMYFNRQKKLDNIDRDSVYHLTGEDIDFDSSSIINFDIRGKFKTNQLCYIRFRKEDDTYIYWLEDPYIPLYVKNNIVYVEINKFQRITNLLRPSGYDKVSIKRFERRIKKWYKHKRT